MEDQHHFLKKEKSDLYFRYKCQVPDNRTKSQNMLFSPSHSHFYETKRSLAAGRILAEGGC